MNNLNRLFAPSTTRLTVEIDHACHSAYIRFSNAKIHKTLSDNRRNSVIAVDVDAKGEIIGIELVGIRNLTIAQIRKNLPDGLKTIDFDRAEWVPAGDRRQNLVPA